MFMYNAPIKCEFGSDLYRKKKEKYHKISNGAI